MKMRITMLLALLLALVCTAASAQEYYTLPEIREQAAAGLHETYTDKYGRTIPVDLEIDVFGEDVAPVLRVGWLNNEKFRDSHNGPYDTLGSAKKKLNGETVYLFESYNGAMIEMDKAYGVEHGNSLTPREAFAFFAERLAIQGISADGYLYDQPQTFNVLCSLNKKTGEVVAPAFYNIIIWPQMYKLPIMTHVNWSFEKYKGPICSAEAIFMMRNNDEYTIIDESFVEKEMLAEDIPLCSIEKLIQSSEKQIKGGYIQKVMSLRFGYAVFNDPAIASKRMSSRDVEDWYLVPSWILECRYSASPKKDYDERVNPKLIVINAQTGEMLDPRDKSYKECGDSRYKGFIPWDKVQ